MIDPLSAVVSIGSAIAIVGGATYSIFFTPRERRRRREKAALRAAGVVRIADLVEGQTVRVTGTVRLADGVAPITSPVSRRECVYYSARASRLEEGMSAAHGASSETLKLTEGRAMDFLLVDDSGVAEVITEHANFDSDFDVVETTRGKGFTPEQVALLERHAVAVPTGNEIVRPVYIFSDAVFELGERVTVLARVRFAEIDPTSVVTNPNADYRGSARPRRVLLVAPEGGNVLISDDKKVAT